MVPAADAIRGQRSAHSLATGPVIAEPFISPLGFTMTPALSVMGTSNRNNDKKSHGAVRISTGPHTCETAHTTATKNDSDKLARVTATGRPAGCCHTTLDYTGQSAYVFLPFHIHPTPSALPQPQLFSNEGTVRRATSSPSINQRTFKV